MDRLDLFFEDVENDYKEKELGVVSEAKLGSYQYTIPEDNEELMFDFYMMTLFPNTTGDDDIDAAIKDMKRKLIPHLKQEMLRVVFISLASEFAHAQGVDGDGDSGGDSYFRTNLKTSKAEDKFLNKYANLAGDDYLSDMPYADRARELQKLMNRMGWDEADVVRLMYKIYSDVDGWDGGYGGKAWAKIAKGWLGLAGVSDPQQTTAWIDHIYDLQHNNDTVFNKVREYAKDGGYHWIKKALDYKAKIKSPFALYDNISPQLKRLAGFATKAATGETLEQYLKSPEGKKNKPPKKVG